MRVLGHGRGCPNAVATLLVLIGLGSGGCKGHAERGEVGRTGEPPETSTTTTGTGAGTGAGAGPVPSEGPARFEGPGEYLPHPDVAGWRIAGAPRYFDATTLFNLIDGASELYIAYGMRRLATVDYHPASGHDAEKTVQIYVYDMGSPLAAFGRWSRLVDERGDPASLGPHLVAIGGGGLVGSTQLQFWKASALVEITYLDESSDATEAAMAQAARDLLPAIANAIEARLPGGRDLPAEVAALPREGLVAGGTTYFVRSVQGFDAIAPLGPVIIAHYGAGGGRFRLVVARKPNPADAAAAFAQARGVLAGATPVAGLGDEAVRGRDGARGAVLLARGGATVVAAVESGVEGAALAPEAARIQRIRQALTGH